MKENEEIGEDGAFKVSDRRKFNPDGSLKDGVTIEPKRATEPVAEKKQDEKSDKAFDDEEIPGAEDPASFVNFLSTLTTNAAAALGALPHPATGKRSVDLETGKYWLDVLAMLKEKTKGNLHELETRLLEGILADLRMQYVTMVRVTEEKLKEQAAKKFTAGDILGKK